MNFGGFVSVSTVDWRGHSVGVVFFRGCPIKCWYCQNHHILTGVDMRETSDVLFMIKDASLLISGVVFSGGEATMQPDALMYLATGAKKLDLKTGLHTNGVYPEVINQLITEGLIDHIALDIKAEWNLYAREGRNETNVCDRVTESLKICTEAFLSGKLQELFVVITLFRFYGDEVMEIIRDVDPHIPVILGQGRHQGIKEQSLDELKSVADKIGRPVYIRTMQDGEIYYEGISSSRNAGIR